MLLLKITTEKQDSDKKTAFFDVLVSCQETMFFRSAKGGKKRSGLPTSLARLGPENYPKRSASKLLSISMHSEATLQDYFMILKECSLIFRLNLEWILSMSSISKPTKHFQFSKTLAHWNARKRLNPPPPPGTKRAEPTSTVLQAPKPQPDPQTLPGQSPKYTSDDLQVSSFLFLRFKIHFLLSKIV